MPVDFVAHSISKIAVSASGSQINRCRLYHVLTADYAKGANLDDVVSWIQSAGYPLKRLESREEWIQEFAKR